MVKQLDRHFILHEIPTGTFIEINEKKIPTLQHMTLSLQPFEPGNEAGHLSL